MIERPRTATQPEPRLRGCSTVFLDRDGTVNVEAPDGQYVTSPAELSLIPGRWRGHIQAQCGCDARDSGDQTALAVRPVVRFDRLCAGARPYGVTSNSVLRLRRDLKEIACI